ncbi:hypothetical protein FE374_12340 [Georgenia yuyongxinii]|uniref:Uncharacterized protein n=1 Tax=Georgenia yuyongxinii TaxID=2589797 RepID=A0A5B8C7G8_9MICO|nr:hypothetical protein FE374_12340 [Georgenia yuyongxinii]
MRAHPHAHREEVAARAGPVRRALRLGAEGDVGLVGLVRLARGAVAAGGSVRRTGRGAVRGLVGRRLGRAGGGGAARGGRLVTAVGVARGQRQRQAHGDGHGDLGRRPHGSSVPRGWQPPPVTVRGGRVTAPHARRVDADL